MTEKSLCSKVGTIARNIKQEIKINLTLERNTIQIILKASVTTKC